MSGYMNVGAINGFPMYGSYANYAGLSNLYDSDLMGTSVFNGMMPFMPAFGGGVN